MNNKKIEHSINLKIPMSIWDKVEKLRLKKKMKLPDRKLLLKDFVVELIDKGCNESA